MSDEPATSAPTTPSPSDEPKHDHTADAQPAATEHAPEPTAMPEAEASVEQVTSPELAHEPEPAPAPPPELAEPELAAQMAAEATESPAPTEPSEPEPVAEPPVETTSEALVPTEPPAGASAEPAPASEAEAPAKPKRTRKPKAATATDTADAPTGTVTPTAAPAESAADSKKKWYAIKVQSGREESIKAAILRKVAIEGLEEFLGRIEIPVEEVVEKKQVKVKDKKTGEYTYQEKKVTKKKKKFHGYIFAELEFNDRILYLFRETSGVGDFLNMRGKPPIPEPMPEHEVQSMLTGVSVKDPSKKQAKIKIDFEKGDRVRIRDGSFANQEGDVKLIIEAKDPTDSPKVTVTVTLWGRPVDVDLEYWQVEKV